MADMTLQQARNLLGVECAIAGKAVDAAWKVVDAHLAKLSAPVSEKDAYWACKAKRITRDEPSEYEIVRMQAALTDFLARRMGE